MHVVPEFISIKVRYLLAKLLLDRVGRKVKLRQDIIISGGSHIQVGNNVSIGPQTILAARKGGEIKIKDGATISYNAKLLSGGLDYKMRGGLENKTHTAKPILIKKNAWIGGGAIILGGVIVGKNSVVGAGSVVTRNVEDNSVVIGVPAKKIDSIKK